MTNLTILLKKTMKRSQRTQTAAKAKAIEEEKREMTRMLMRLLKRETLELHKKKNSRT